MKLYIFINFLGIFAFNERNELLEYELFPQNPEKIGDILLNKKESYTKKFTEKIKAKFKGVEIEKINTVDFDFCHFSLENKIFKSEEEFYNFLKEVSVFYTEKKISQVPSQDLFLIELVKLLKDLNTHTNPLKERLKSIKTLENKNMENKVIKELENNLENLKVFKEDLEREITDLAQKTMPNTSLVLGEILSAQLLAHAGSLKKLARLPSSTIQVLGAEKALFRYMKDKKRPPKHGILFLHPKVNTLKKEKRGQMTRFLANKISLLAKLDYYGGEFKGNEIEKQVEQKYQSLKQK